MHRRKAKAVRAKAAVKSANAEINEKGLDSPFFNAQYTNIAMVMRHITRPVPVKGRFRVHRDSVELAVQTTISF